ncbi:MAG: hypothetical protein JWO42_165 [Chloroflexi bacterium]|nr:hypothetical protein [Chloroflexota bacterium]
MVQLGYSIGPQFSGPYQTFESPNENYGRLLEVLLLARASSNSHSLAASRIGVKRRTFATEKCLNTKLRGAHHMWCAPRSFVYLVGARGFEPPTSRSRTVRSTRLSHAPYRASELYRYATSLANSLAACIECWNTPL